VEDNMSTLNKLDKKGLKDLLSKCWLSHDGIWFYHCIQEFGVKKANMMNKTAIKSLAPLEIKRIMKALGVEKVETFEQMRELIFEDALALVTSESVRNGFNFTCPEKNIIQWEVKEQNCFAYIGTKNVGISDKYECGVIYRIGCWLDSLGIEYRVTPQIEGCLMHTNGKCSGDFKFDI